MSEKRKVIAISGGFDPVHIGHVQMIKEASKWGIVTVVINSDEWLMRKKGYVFMTFDDRCEIIQGIAGVKKVVEVDDSDGTVVEAIQKYEPDIFGNGGDRTMKNTPEITICEKLEIETLWGLGGGKIRSSSDIVESAKDEKLPI